MNILGIFGGFSGKFLGEGMLPSLKARLRAEARPTREAEQAGQGGEYRPHLIALGVLTTLYLCVELAFLADLLDVVGGAPKLEEIEAIETRGRFISGLALTLLTWSWIVLPWLRRWGSTKVFSAGALALSAMFCIGTSYQVQEAIIRGIVTGSSAEDRQSALLLTMVSQAVQAGDLDLEGISLSRDMLDSASGKAFVALLPALASEVTDLARRADPVFERVAIRGALTAAPAPEELHRRYLEVQEAASAQYEALKGVQAAFDQTTAGLDLEVDAAWDRFAAGLLAKGITPGRVPSVIFPQVRAAARDQGVPVPDAWNPNDETGFRNLVSAGLFSRHIEVFSATAQRETGDPAVPSATLEDHLASAPVQMRLAEAGILTGAVVPAGLSREAFTRDVYPAVIDKVAALRVEQAKAELASFGPEGANREAGEAAVKAAWVPLVALLFSMLGAVTHTVKSGVLLVKIRHAPASRARARGIKGVAALAAALVVLPALLPNAVTASPFFTTVTEGQGLFARVLSWIIEAQPVFHLAGSIARKILLAG